MVTFEQIIRALEHNCKRDWFVCKLKHEAKKGKEKGRYIKCTF